MFAFALSVSLCALALGVGRPAAAVVVATTTENTSAPEDDPGFDNVGRRGIGSGIYLGNRWVLTPAHVGAGPILLDDRWFDPKPETIVQLKNPPMGDRSEFTDLVMFQLGDFPDLDGVDIAHMWPPPGAETVMIGSGRDREEDLTKWTADWTETNSNIRARFKGFKTTDDRTLRWGTNEIEGNRQNGSTWVVNVNTGHGDVLSLYTEFDEIGGLPDEAQGVRYDSGGAAFYKRGGNWELAGAIVANGLLPGQDQVGGIDTAVFDNRTYLADLSVYGDRIEQIRATVETTRVVDRRIYYRRSGFDSSGLADSDPALAPDKRPLMPGETASFDNYTSYDRGINAVAIDVAHLAAPDAIDEESFRFLVGNSDDVSLWHEAPEPANVDVRYYDRGDDDENGAAGNGEAGVYRIVVRWNDNAIENEWLQVTLVADEATGLTSDDVFYFGNAIGESGNRPGNTFVDAADVLGTRDHAVGPLDAASIDNAFDFNRDRAVDALDTLIARNHATSPLDTLRLIAVPNPQPTDTAEVNPVPEPTTGPLLLTGLLVVIGRRRQAGLLARRARRR